MDSMTTGLAVFGGLRIFQQPEIQDALPHAWQWRNWPVWAQWLVVGGLSAATTFIQHRATGAPIDGALVAMSLERALMAIGDDGITRRIGRALAASKLADDPLWRPETRGILARIVGRVALIDDATLARARKEALGTAP